MGKVIGHIYKHSQRNWPHSPPNTNLVLPQSPGSSMQTQQNISCNASVGAHALSSSVSDQINFHHVNTDVNYN